MEQKNDIGYFSANMGIYPRQLYIVIGNDKLKVIKDNFTSRDGEELIYDNDGDKTCASCMWSVIEKTTGDYGFLVWLRGKNPKSDITHESYHVACETFKDIGAYEDAENQEPFAYLIGWVAKQIKYVLNYKGTKK